MDGRTGDRWEIAMESNDLNPDDGGATSIERRGSQPLCNFDPESGFSLNLSVVDEMRWYTYLSSEDLDESLLQSRHDD